MSTRTDDASDEAEVERMERWWGPKDFTVRHSAMDGRRSGIFHYGLQAENRGTIRGRRLFREIAAPERLVFVAALSDEKGGAARDPFPGNRPVETLSTVLFADEGGRTAVAAAATPETATEEDRVAFAAGFDPRRQGWAGAFDQLTGFLARA